MPPSQSANKVVQRTRAVAFLDGVVAAYHKLDSLSATWRRSLYDPAQGSVAWRRATLPLLRFENQKDRLIFVSDGQRTHLTIGKTTTGVGIDRLSHLDKDTTAGLLDNIDSDEITPYLLRGQNPLRSSRWRRSDDASAHGEARLLGVATVHGVRCRGVDINEVIEGRDSTTTQTFRLWFGPDNVLRRYQVFIDSSPDQVGSLFQVVDYQVHSNVKLSPALFFIPNRPDSDE